jgi:DNA-binding protein H-NS
MKNLVAIQAQIEDLQKQAAELRQREFRKTVAEIVAQMRAFGITVEDIREAQRREAGAAKAGGRRGRPKKAAAAAAGAPAAKRKPAPIKYRGPAGETWTGRGKQPRWLKALVDLGRKPEEFLI